MSKATNSLLGIVAASTGHIKEESFVADGRAQLRSSYANQRGTSVCFSNGSAFVCECPAAAATTTIVVVVTIAVSIIVTKFTVKKEHT